METPLLLRPPYSHEDKQQNKMQTMRKIHQVSALHLAHAYLIGATIHTPEGNRSPTKEEVIEAIQSELNVLHGYGCWSWGPGHYMCAYKKIKDLSERND